MENDTLNYTALKEKIVEQLVVLQELIAEKGYERSRAELTELLTKLKEDRINLVVLGYFNRGKSTLINYLLGEDLLPTSIIPLTSVITLINTGKLFKTEVHFKDRIRRQIALEEISRYATVPGNPGNEKNVERIEISFPASYLKEGIVIVDTPGFSSVHLANTLITQNYLPEADVALFLIAADPPISQAELEFLKEIKAFTDKIFILQNKIDQVNEATRQQSLEFSKRIIETYLNFQELKIYPISAKLGLEGELSNDPEKVKSSFLPDFERALEEFLLQEKGQVVLLTSVDQGLKLLTEVKMAMELERNVYRTTLQDLEDKIKVFNGCIAVIQQEQEDMRDQIQGKVDRLLKSLKPGPPKPEQVFSVKEAFQACYEAHQDEDRKILMQILEACFKRSIQEALKISLLPENEKIQREFEEASVRFLARIHELAKQIQHLSADLFNLQIESPPLIESEKLEIRPFHQTEMEEQTILKIPSVYLLLPKKYFQGIIWQEMLKNVEGELVRNAERLGQEFAEQIQHRARKLIEVLDQQIKITVENVQSALQRTLEIKAKGQKEMDKTVKGVEEKLTQIESIKKVLLGLQKAIMS